MADSKDELKLFETLSSSERMVYIHFKKVSENGKKKIDSSYKEIADTIGLSDATVHRVIESLKERGLVGVAQTEKRRGSTFLFFGPATEESLESVMNLSETFALDFEKISGVLTSQKLEIKRLREKNDLLEAENDRLNRELNLLRNS